MNLPSTHATGQGYPDGWAPGELSRPARRPGRTRWFVALGTLAAVVALSTGLLLADDSRPATPIASVDPQPAVPPGTVASARDTGPIELITEDATCDGWEPVRTGVAAARDAGWEERNAAAPAAAWTQAQRARFTAVGNALHSGADAAVTLATQTPHRVMRGLYEAFAVYGRAYSAALLNYEPADDYLAQTSLAASDAITHVCAASRSRAVSSQVLRVPAAAPPTTKPVAGDIGDPERFLPQQNRICSAWRDDEAALDIRMRQWSALDPTVGVARLDDAQIAIYADAARTLARHADDMEAAGRGSGNPAVEDFATLGAQYLRAYSQAVSLLWAGDYDMARAGFAVNELITAGCLATVT